MSHTPLPQRLAALKDDGFVDFYELLDVESEATVTRIRTTINALFNEAQSNRDHRNLNRRREYQTLLQLLPSAREFLLDVKNRELYDAFREDYRRGATTTSFEDWSRNLQEAADASNTDKSAVLGVHGQEDRGETEPPKASVTKVPLDKPKRPSRVVVGDDSPAPASGMSRASLMGSVITIAVFFVLFLVLRFAVRLEVPLALLIACIVGIVVWFVTHRKGAKRTKV